VSTESWELQPNERFQRDDADQIRMNEVIPLGGHPNPAINRHRKTGN
jgi:hypothetical protein